MMLLWRDVPWRSGLRAADLKKLSFTLLMERHTGQPPRVSYPSGFLRAGVWERWVSPGAVDL